VPPARGFSLLEVIVAFSVLTLALGVGMALLSQSMLNVGVARDYVQAVALAESLLAETDVMELRSRTESGTSGGLDWRLDVTEQSGPDDHPLRSFVISVEVQAASGRRVSLHSMRLAGGGP